MRQTLFIRSILGCLFILLSLSVCGQVSQHTPNIYSICNRQLDASALTTALQNNQLPHLIIEKDQTNGLSGYYCPYNKSNLIESCLTYKAEVKLQADLNQISFPDNVIYYDATAIVELRLNNEINARRCTLTVSYNRLTSDDPRIALLNNLNGDKTAHQNQEVIRYPFPSDYENVELNVISISGHRMLNGNGQTLQTIQINGNSVQEYFPNLKLDLSVFIEGYEKLSLLPNFNLRFIDPSSAGDNTVEVRWDAIPGAYEYDLEWRFVDLYYGSGNQLDLFKNNSTRVTITNGEQRYIIPWLYERGKIYVRIRAVGKHPENCHRRMEGDWIAELYHADHIRSNAFEAHSCIACTEPRIADNNGRLYSDILQDFPNLHETERWAYDLSGKNVDHPARNLNWQSSLTFAEDAKYKAAISYFDGGLRSRQEVVLNNSQHNAIVSESFYDVVGRPAVHVLPSPVFNSGINGGTSISSVLQFYENFNRDASGNPYNSDNFSLPDASDCSPQQAGEMTTANGASRYYSPTNPLLNQGHHAYIPDAFRYPFTHTQYTNDLTGRVNRQGGVGVDHQLNTGHETKYFYEIPSQQELDALFGTDVGIYTKYFKTTTIDPNGSKSISYTNLINGKTIATSLTQKAPTALDPLVVENSDPEQGTPVIPYEKSLLGGNIKSDHGYSVSHKVNVTQDRTVKRFLYELRAKRVGDVLCDLCMDCEYDLSINLKDACGSSVLADGPIVRSIGKPADHLVCNPEVYGIKMNISQPINQYLSYADSDPNGNLSWNFGTGDFSVEFRYKLEQFPTGDYTIISKVSPQNNTATGFRVYINRNNQQQQIQYTLQLKQNNTTVTKSSPFLAYDNQWHHVVVVRNDDGNPNNPDKVLFYVDGVCFKNNQNECIEQLINSPNNAINVNNTANVIIGAKYNNSLNNFNEHFQGTLAGVKLYKSALTDMDAGYLHCNMDNGLDKKLVFSTPLNLDVEEKVQPSPGSVANYNPAPCTSNCHIEALPPNQTYWGLVAPPACTTSVLLYSTDKDPQLQNGLISNLLEEGEYTVEKKLTVRESAIDAYLAKVKEELFDKETLACETIKTHTQLLEEELEKMDVSGCYSCKNFSDLARVCEVCTTVVQQCSTCQVIDNYNEIDFNNLPNLNPILREFVNDFRSKRSFPVSKQIEKNEDKLYIITLYNERITDCKSCTAYKTPIVNENDIDESHPSPIVKDYVVYYRNKKGSEYSGLTDIDKKLLKHKHNSFVAEFSAQVEQQNTCPTCFRGKECAKKCRSGNRNLCPADLGMLNNHTPISTYLQSEEICEDIKNKIRTVAFLYNNDCGENCTLTTDGIDQLQFWYEGFLLQCKQECSQYNECDIAYEAMLADMTPGGRFLPLSDNERDNLKAGENKDIEDEINNAGSRQPTLWGGIPLRSNTYSVDNLSITYQNVDFDYRDEDGTPSVIYIDGAEKSPKNLSREDFLANFKPSWARQLVKYHPDYCKWIACSLNRVSTEYDRLMAGEQKFSGALSKGFFEPFEVEARVNPLEPFSQSNEQYTPNIRNGNSLAPDPVCAGCTLTFAKDFLANKMIFFYKWQEGRYFFNIWQMAYILTRCMGGVSIDPNRFEQFLTNNGPLQDNFKGCAEEVVTILNTDVITGSPDLNAILTNSGMDEEGKNQYWRNFRTLYASAKQKMVYYFCYNYFYLNRDSYRQIENLLYFFEDTDKDKIAKFLSNKHDFCYPECPVKVDQTKIKPPTFNFPSDISKDASNDGDGSGDGKEDIKNDDETLNQNKAKEKFSEFKKRVADHCATTCEAQAIQWLQSFEKCHSDLLTDDEIKKRLKEDMVKLCKNNCGLNNLFGASEPKEPAKANDPEYSLKALINQYGLQINLDCNLYTQARVGKQGQNYLKGERFAFTDECACSTLKIFYCDFLKQYIGQNNVSSARKLEDFTQAFNHKYQTDFPTSYIKDLLCYCQGGDDYYIELVGSDKHDKEGNGLVINQPGIGDPILSMSGNGILSTKDGGYLTVGQLDNQNFRTGSAFYVQKLDISGNVEWTNNLCYEHEFGGKAISLTETSDGYAVLSYLSNSDQLQINTIDVLGNTKSTYTLAGTGVISRGATGLENTAFQNAITAPVNGSGTVVATAKNHSFRSSMPSVLRLTNDGKIGWNTRLLLDTINFRGYYQQIESVGNGYLAAGALERRKNLMTDTLNRGLLITRMNEQGNIIWHQTLRPFNADSNFSLIKTQSIRNDEYVVVAAANHRLNRLASDIYTFRLGSQGQIINTQRTQITDNYGVITLETGSLSATVTDVGAITLSGTGYSLQNPNQPQSYLVRTNGSGNTEWAYHLGINGKATTLAQHVARADGGITAVGTATEVNGTRKQWIMSVDRSGRKNVGIENAVNVQSLPVMGLRANISLGFWNYVAPHPTDRIGEQVIRITTCNCANVNVKYVQVTTYESQGEVVQTDTSNAPLSEWGRMLVPTEMTCVCDQCITCVGLEAVSNEFFTYINSTEGFGITLDKNHPLEDAAQDATIRKMWVNYLNQKLGFGLGYWEYIDYIYKYCDPSIIYSPEGYSKTSVNGQRAGKGSALESHVTYGIPDCYLSRMEGETPPLCDQGWIRRVIEPYNDCFDNLYLNTLKNVDERFASDRNTLLGSLRHKLIEKCLAGVEENFLVLDTLREYQFTLYYYNQAGNLVMTVPPKAVKPLVLADKILRQFIRIGHTYRPLVNSNANNRPTYEQAINWWREQSDPGLNYVSDYPYDPFKICSVIKPAHANYLFFPSICSNPSIANPYNVYEQVNNTDFYRYLLTTRYRHNTLDQVIEQISPDGNVRTWSENFVPWFGFNCNNPQPVVNLAGFTDSVTRRMRMPINFSSEMWYDDLGRPIASRNPRQKKDGRYGYVLYDALGRIYETGEAKTTVGTWNANPEFFNINPGLYRWSSVPYDPNIVVYQDHYLQADNFRLGVEDQTKTLRNQVSRTYYDKLPSFYTSLLAQNLRTRVAMRTYHSGLFIPTVSGLREENYSSAQVYDYDVHGNVAQMQTDIPENALFDGQNVQSAGKTLLQYDYDLISGKVNLVKYQPGQPDQYYHKYIYDADNRLLSVHTSRDGYLWDQDARQFYYLHGPLARMEIGETKVQGVDYTYTIHGWIKGVNSSTVTPVRDMGQDGYMGAHPVAIQPSHRYVAKDVFGYTLGYYKEFPINGSPVTDYQAIGANSIDQSQYFEALQASGSGLKTNCRSLYNGNISSMVTGFHQRNTLTPEQPQMTYNELVFGGVYRYDALNRLKDMRMFTNVAGNVWQPEAVTDRFHSEYQYDENGNILKLKRFTAGGVLYDDLSYDYYEARNLQNSPNLNQTNRLGRVTDLQINRNDNQTDLLTQSSTKNYKYDAIGNLVSIESENIANVVWNAGGKVLQVQRNTWTGQNTNDYKLLNFTYDVSGNRLTKSKHDIGKDVYMRDASGNVMAVYGLKGEGESGPPQNLSNLPAIQRNFVKQVHCLLQEKLGTQLLDGVEWGNQSFQNQLRVSMQGLNLNNCTNNVVSQYINLTQQLWNNNHRNLFGNAVNEYLRSGSLNLVNRGSLVTRQRWYVYSQKEVHLYGGSRLGIDETERPLMRVQVSEVWNPFNGTWCDPVAVQGSMREVWVNGAWVGENTPFPAQNYERFVDSTGKKRYELSNHLGNVLAVVSDRKLPQYQQGDLVRIAYYEADQLSLKLYDPFGTIAQEWRITGTYRYSFNGKESDSEWDGGGAMFDYGFRIYDPRLGRFLSVDPLTEGYPWYTPYQFSSNTPIQSIDLDGLESSPATELMDGFKEMYRTVITPKSYIDLLDGFQKFHEINKEKGGAYDLVGVTDAKITLTGTDWQGQKQNRAVAAGMTLLAFFPVEKLGVYGLRATGMFWRISTKEGIVARHLYMEKFYKVAPHFIGASERVLANAIGSQTGALREAFKAVKYTFQETEQAHHIIPYELLKDFKVFRDAVDKGFDFNGVINGIPLLKAFHVTASGATNHPKYTNQIREFVGIWYQDIAKKGNYTPEKALDLMNQVAGSVKSQIEAAKASGLKHLDDIKLDFSTIVQPK